MKRRRFLQGGILAWAGLSMGRRASAGGDGTSPEGSAVVISAWDFGPQAHRAAWKVLADGGTPLDAVQQGVMVVESDPEVTSVGYGGLPNSEGNVELDAALMHGGTLDAGSVAGLRGIRNPVAVARKVMELTPHVLLVGDGARRFALQHGFEEQTLLTERARKAWEEHMAKSAEPTLDDHDTIGMVALDRRGHMAAACTTSGLAWKLPGRVGDSPLVGHGLYCDDRAGGAAATGIGEEVIKVCGSYQVVEFMRQGVDPDEAIRRVLERIRRRERKGGPPSVAFVALRADGKVGFASMLPGFKATLSREGTYKVLTAPTLT